METSLLLEIGFTFTGLLGATLLATYSKYSPWGWVAFMFTNLITIAFAIHHNFWGLMIQQVFFCATSALGIHRSGILQRQSSQTMPTVRQGQEQSFDLWWSAHRLEDSLDKKSARLAWQAALAQESNVTNVKITATSANRIRAI